MKPTVYLILFRGVGGKTQLPTKTLREKLTEAGFENVATYINSGNAIVRSGLSQKNRHDRPDLQQGIWFRQSHLCTHAGGVG